MIRHYWPPWRRPDFTPPTMAEMAEIVGEDRPELDPWRWGPKLLASVHGELVRAMQHREVDRTEAIRRLHTQRRAREGYVALQAQLEAECGHG